MKKDKKIFTLATKISLRPEYFGGLLFMPITGEIIQVNHTAFSLLEQILKYGALQAASKDLDFWKELQVKGLVREVNFND